MSVYDKIFPPRVLTLPNGKQVSKPRSRAPLAAVILLALTILSVEVTGFDMGVLVSRIREFFVILGEMIPPEKIDQLKKQYPEMPAFQGIH